MTFRNLTVTPPRVPRWRYNDMIAHIGGVQALTRHLIARGYAPPPPDTVKGWKTRNSIPSSWLPAVLAVAIEVGALRKADDLVIEETR